MDFEQGGFAVVNFQFDSKMMDMRDTAFINMNLINCNSNLMINPSILDFIVIPSFLKLFLKCRYDLLELSQDLDVYF